MTRGALVTAALALLLGSSAVDLRVSLRSTAAAYLASMPKIGPIAGRDTTYDYYQRLNEDGDLLDDPSVPQGYSAADWSQTVTRIARLDLSLATQLVRETYDSMSAVRGLSETLVRSSSDGTMQPVAVYVPSSYSPARPAPLVVLLHGRPQSETQVIAPPYIADLAERSGAIVVAPWGRGYYDFRGSSADVYDALDAATRAFSIDPRRRYIAGYSMGGFSVFEVAPARPQVWAAVMSVAGALLGSDSQRLVATMRRTPFYVLTGSADDSIPTQFPTATAAFLQAAGLDVSFYSQPGGIHRLVTLLPILTEAWNDMLHGVVRAPQQSLGSMTLPSAIPTSNFRP